MPPVVRSLGRGIEGYGRNGEGGLNPLRGPSAALAAPGGIVAHKGRWDKRQRVELAGDFTHEVPTGEREGRKVGHAPELKGRGTVRPKIGSRGQGPLLSRGKVRPGAAPEHGRCVCVHGQ